jgi:glucan phosphorylase
MPVHEKTLQELEQKYAAVMNNKAISDFTTHTPKNSATEVSHAELMDRVERFAPEMQEIMRQLDNETGGRND